MWTRNPDPVGGGVSSASLKLCRDSCETERNLCLGLHFCVLAEDKIVSFNNTLAA